MRAFENRRGRAAIFGKNYQLGFGKRILEQFKGSTGSSTKAVDTLIGIADCEDVLIRASQLLKNFKLREVGVLKFVDENKAGAGARPFEQSRI